MNNVIHIADQTFISAKPGEIRACLDALQWDELWPGLQCIITQDRENLGIRWKIAGPIEGTMELWFETRLDGVIVHFFLHGTSTCPESRTMRKLDYPVTERSERSLHSLQYWHAKNFRFRWDQHGVRRNARNIAYSLKIRAEMNQ